MKVFTIPLPPMMTNCYIAFERTNGKCFIIDPAINSNRIIDSINSLNLKPKAILLTHGHFDHIGAVDELCEKYTIPVYIHSHDSEMIKSPSMNCSQFMSNEPVNVQSTCNLLNGGENIKLENESLRVFHTPGHSEGSCVFVCKNVIFSGDTVFQNGYGRYDLYGGNYGNLIESIQKILSFDESLSILPGHGESTTVADEKQFYHCN